MTRRSLTPLCVAAGLAMGWACTSASIFQPPPDAGQKDAGGTGGGMGGGGGGSALDGGLKVDAACEVLNRERCAYYARCGLVGTGEDALERCRNQLSATWCGPSNWPARVAPAVATLRYDGLLAQDCAEAFSTRSCQGWDGVPASCTSFLRPAANLRQVCYGGFQECVEGVCRGAACPRTCQARGVANEVCRQDSDCVTRLFCRQSTTTPGVGTCAPWADIEEPCDSSTRCLEGLWCHQSKCVQLPPTGQACLYGRCDDSAWCDGQQDGGLCLARKNLGAACTPGQCLPELWCGTLSGVCEPKVLEQVGAPCTQEQQCPTGTVCVGWTANAPGVCEAAHEEGLGCLRHQDCESYLACLPGDGGMTCAPRRPDGEACEGWPECRVFSTCAHQTCTALPDPGLSCDATQRCAWGACVDAGTAGFKCALPLGPGAACASGTDCASGHCEQGLCLASCAP